MSDSDYLTRLKTAGRNDPCPCGSGKKYKKCHLAEDEGARTEALKASHEEAIEKAKASKDTDGQTEQNAADQSTPSFGRQKKQPGSKGRDSDGRPKNIPRRGAV